jgi:hypothetical protein
MTKAQKALRDARLDPDPDDVRKLGQADRFDPGDFHKAIPCIGFAPHQQQTSG